jgi:hypothetical protein
MAKKKIKEEEVKEEIEAVEVAPTEKSEYALPVLGDVVHYYKQVQTQTGKKIEKFAAIVIGFPGPGTNFQKKDMAVDLKVLTSNNGGSDEVKHGVMHSEAQIAGRWCFKS